MFDIASRHIPNLKQHILFIEAGSPRTMERYTLNAFGAAYGWEISPHQIGPGRLSNQSPIPNLYFSGHWTEPGGGIYAVSVSGIRTAQLVFEIQNEGQLWKLLDLEHV
jgi:prolycopene isomerase